MNESGKYSDVQKNTKNDSNAIQNNAGTASRTIDKSINTGAPEIGNHDDEIYDEFGNYIGPDLAVGAKNSQESNPAGDAGSNDSGLYSSESEYDIEHQIKMRQRDARDSEEEAGAEGEADAEMQVVLHEDK